MRPDREGKRFVAAHVDEATHKDIRVLAALESTTVDGIMSAAVADYLKKRGRRVSRELTQKLRSLGIA